jgi:hypothetical protein
MEIKSNDKIYGVPEGILYGQNERVDELNDRIKMRQFPDSPLEPNFTPRAVPTKYSIFPIVNRRKPLHEPVVPYLEYNVLNFNPGSRQGPPSGFLNNIDIETTLRNQTFAYQRGHSHGVYIPSSKSDLYNVTVPIIPGEQTHPLLFQQAQFSQMVHPNLLNSNVGKEQLFNHTRTQLRSSTPN